ncbi:MAG TPA: hypothetical protein VLW85_05960 [Myxococcales bacterium]|nr:hypothetical protein [Myxococcales bacterium]
MNRANRWALAVVVLAAACRYDQTGETATCTITLSGAVTGTYDCRPAHVWWSPSVGNAAALEFEVAPTAGRPSVEASIGFAHQPSVGHFSSSESDAEGFFYVTATDGTFYSMQVGPPFNVGAFGGTWDLTFDKCDGPLRRYVGFAFDTSGSADVSIDNGNGTVTAHITF